MNKLNHLIPSNRFYNILRKLHKGAFFTALIAAFIAGASPLMAATHDAILSPAPTSSLESYEVESTIEHTDNITDVLQHIDSSTAALFDIDVTLIASDDNEGVAGERWLVDFYGKRIDHLLQTNQIEENRFLNDLSSSLWWFVQKRPIEESTVDVIKQIQEKSAFSAGFTARGREIRFTYKLKSVPPNQGHNTAAKKTVEEMRDIGIDFSLGSDKFPEAWRKDLNEFDGILFTDGKSKKDFLAELITRTGYKPERIVFVDDSEGNVKAVQQVCKEFNIPFKGFVYDHVLHNPENLRTYWSFDASKENHLDKVDASKKTIEILVDKGVFTKEDASSLEGITDGDTLLDNILLLYYSRYGIL